MKTTSHSDSQQNTSPVLLISMLIIAVFFSMAARVIFSPLMPALQNELGGTLSTAGTLFLLANISYALAMLFSGFLTARIGHGKTIVAALASITFGLSLTAIAPGLMLLAVGMLLIGAGAGAYPPSGIAMINAKTSIQGRNTAFSFHEIGPNLALLLAPLIVLALEPWFGWRGVLIWMAAVCGLAAVAFLRWGASDSGVGAAPDIRTMSTILRLRGTLVGMVILSATLAGLQGVYSILPAYLVTEHSLPSQYVNFLVTVSRIACVLFLLRAGAIITYFGRRQTIIWILLFSSFFTALVGLVQGTLISIIVIIQPALLAVLVPALLSSVSEIGEIRYQNITYAVVISIGVSVGGGLTPALLGFFGDLGLAWLGFIALAGYMVSAVLFLLATPEFGRD
jgi:NNP family nitrate/nitrite transporter-like MFS transporter